MSLKLVSGVRGPRRARRGKILSMRKRFQLLVELLSKILIDLRGLEGRERDSPRML